MFFSSSTTKWTFSDVKLSNRHFLYRRVAWDNRVPGKFFYPRISARKINASTGFDICTEQLSPFDGLLGLIKFLDLIDLAEIFKNFSKNLLSHKTCKNFLHGMYRENKKLSGHEQSGHTMAAGEQ